MPDEMLSRLWTEHHEPFSGDLGRFFASLAAGYRRLMAVRLRTRRPSPLYPPQA